MANNDDIPERILINGWLDRKSTTSLINPWAKRFIVLTTHYLKVYHDNHLTALKKLIKLDSTTRIVILQPNTNNNNHNGSKYYNVTYRFCIITADDMLELSTESLEVRNDWLGYLIYTAEMKSELGYYVCNVKNEIDFKNIRSWESAIVSHSILESSGLKPPVVGSKTNLIDKDHVHTPHTTSVTTNTKNSLVLNDNYASFAPYEQWEEKFEPETVKLRHEKERLEEMKAKGMHVPSASNLSERFKDYMYEKIVTNVTSLSTDKSCKLLMDGMALLVGASERQLARKYLEQTNHPDYQYHHQQQESHITTTTSSTSVIDNNNLDSHTTTALNEVVSTTVTRHIPDIPLSVHEDLMCTLGSLRALLLTFRFVAPPASYSNEAQIDYSRKLAVHRLVRSLSKVLTSLEHMEREAKLTEVKDMIRQLVKQESICMASKKDSSVDHNNNQDKDEELLQIRKQIDTAMQDLALYSSLDQGAVIWKKAAIKRIYAILRPLLSRECLMVEAAPILTEFCSVNKSRMDGLEGLTAEITTIFGDALQLFLEKKITELEEVLIQQLEIFVNIISDNQTSNTIFHNDQVAIQHEAENMEHLLKGDVLGQIAVEKAAAELRFLELTAQNSPYLWSTGDPQDTERILIEIIILDKINELWYKLHTVVSSLISGGLYALLEMIGGGTTTSNTNTTNTTNTTSS